MYLAVLAVTSILTNDARRECAAGPWATVVAPRDVDRQKGPPCLASLPIHDTHGPLLTRHIGYAHSHYLRGANDDAVPQKIVQYLVGGH